MKKADNSLPAAAPCVGNLYDLKQASHLVLLHFLNASVSFLYTFSPERSPADSKDSLSYRILAAALGDRHLSCIVSYPFKRTETGGRLPSGGRCRCREGDVIVRRERRKHKRFEIRDEVFAAFVVPGEPIIVGKVLDASLGGVCVQYLATRKLDPGPANISIFGLNSPRMNRMESTVMYDLAVPEEAWSDPETRRCGIRFEKRRSEVKARLKEVLGANAFQEPRTFPAQP